MTAITVAIRHGWVQAAAQKTLHVWRPPSDVAHSGNLLAQMAQAAAMTHTATRTAAHKSRLMTSVIPTASWFSV
jgi:hypothetical protein